MLNAGFFSVPTAGDLSGTGMADIVVGGIEGYLVHYRCLAVSPSASLCNPPLQLLTSC